MNLFVFHYLLLLLFKFLFFIFLLLNFLYGFISMNGCLGCFEIFFPATLEFQKHIELKISKKKRGGSYCGV